MHVKFPCEHWLLDGQHNAKKGLSLITIGNQLRSDDGIAVTLCTKICRFDLGLYTNFIADCFRTHQAVIIVDATTSGAKLGAVHIIDLKSIVDRNIPMPVRSSHGLSIIDEIRLQKLQLNLPESIIFFGIEVAEVGWSDQISTELENKLPGLTDKLSSLIEDVLQTDLLQEAANHA